MIFETPSQYELRTMPEAFGGCATRGGTRTDYKLNEQHSEDFYKQWREYEEEEKRKATLCAKIDDLCYRVRKNPELDSELTQKIIELENELNNFHLLPKHIL